VDHVISEDDGRMPASGRAAPAPMSTERSDAQSEGLEKDGIGRWTRLGPIPERHRHGARGSCRTGRTSICTIAGRLGAATFAISKDCDASVACWWQRTGVDVSSPSHGMPAAIRSLIRSWAENEGQT
jgi:hypothetical protein